MDATAETELNARVDNAVKDRMAQAIGSIGPCLLSAAMTAVPVFLQSFIACISGGGGGASGAYNPGNRPRCG